MEWWLAGVQIIACSLAILAGGKWTELIYGWWRAHRRLRAASAAEDRRVLELKWWRAHRARGLRWPGVQAYVQQVDDMVKRWEREAREHQERRGQS